MADSVETRDGIWCHGEGDYSYSSGRRDPLDDALDYVARIASAVAHASPDEHAQTGNAHAAPNRDSIYPDPAAAIPDSDSDSDLDCINAGLDRLGDNGACPGGRRDVDLPQPVDRGRSDLRVQGGESLRNEAGTPMTCPHFDCYIAGPHSHGIGTALTEYGERERSGPASGHLISAAPVFDPSYDEVRRVLIAFHRQEGDGIVSVKRLAKRLYEESASTTDLDKAGYFPPALSPSSSYGGTE